MSSPIYNAILFYILFVIIILFAKPEIMYCNKTGKFKPFGCGDDQSLVCFPVACIASAISLYFIFLIMQVIGNFLSE